MRTNICYFPFRGRQKKKLADFIELKIDYEDILGKKRTGEYKLLFEELSGKGNLIPPDTHIGNIGYRLEKIEKILEKIEKGLNRHNDT